MKNPTQINGSHCQQCGSTDYEDIYSEGDGYSACCNEIVMLECDLHFCSHGCRYPETPDGYFEDVDCLVHGAAHA